MADAASQVPWSKTQTCTMLQELREAATTQAAHRPDDIVHYEKTRRVEEKRQCANIQMMVKREREVHF